MDVVDRVKYAGKFTLGSLYLTMGSSKLIANDAALDNQCNILNQSDVSYQSTNQMVM